MILSNQRESYKVIPKFDIMVKNINLKNKLLASWIFLKKEKYKMINKVVVNWKRVK